MHVPYRGNADVAAGRVTFWIPPIGSALPFIRDGRLLALGVTTRERSAWLPQVPTIAEAGVAGFENFIWFGMWAPAGMPEDLVDQLAKDVAEAVRSHQVHAEFGALFAQPMNMTPAQFSRFARSEAAAAVRLAEMARMTPQSLLPR